jgi:hypothetical protein
MQDLQDDSYVIVDFQKVDILIPSLLRAKLLPGHERFKRCYSNENKTDEEKGFLIDHICYQIDELCSYKIRPQIYTISEKKMNEWQYHPQHLTICQNGTFWKKQRRNSRKSYYFLHIQLIT